LITSTVGSFGSLLFALLLRIFPSSMRTLHSKCIAKEAVHETKASLIPPLSILLNVFDLTPADTLEHLPIVSG
jgi:hypothetical protein